MRDDIDMSQVYWIL